MTCLPVTTNITTKTTCVLPPSMVMDVQAYKKKENQLFNDPYGKHLCLCAGKI